MTLNITRENVLTQIFTLTIIVVIIIILSWKYLNVTLLLPGSVGVYYVQSIVKIIEEETINFNLINLIVYPLTLLTRLNPILAIKIVGATFFPLTFLTSYFQTF